MGLLDKLKIDPSKIVSDLTNTDMVKNYVQAVTNSKLVNSLTGMNTEKSDETKQKIREIFDARVGGGGGGVHAAGRFFKHL
ncbi:MAG: hypothetical protein LBD67_03015 [Candidatus Accumulibacter sp.]|nr:hypothetical protein [Accumulibacter sp.]